MFFKVKGVSASSRFLDESFLGESSTMLSLKTTLFSDYRLAGFDFMLTAELTGVYSIASLISSPSW